MTTSNNKIFIVCNFFAVVINILISLFLYFFVNISLFELIRINIFFLFAAVFFTFVLSKIETQIRICLMLLLFIVVCILFVFCLYQSIMQRVVNQGFIVFNYLFSNILYRHFFDPNFYK